MLRRALVVACCCWLAASSHAVAGEPEPAPPKTMAEVLTASTAGDWRSIPAEHLLLLELPAGVVTIELAPHLAPQHVAAVEHLVRHRFFDGLAVVRAQDNYVVQWGDPAEKAEERRALPEGFPAPRPELELPLGDETPFTPLADGDVYASEVGFSDGFPVARDRDLGLRWAAHCYGMVGVGRDVAPESSTGAELYVVIGHAPRHLDRNTALVGRVVDGVEHFSTLPRGTGPLGFYETPEERVPIRSARLAAELPVAERPEWEALRTDTATFAALVEARRHRTESWFAFSPGRVGLCNVPLPVRTRPAPGEGGR